MFNHPAFSIIALIDPSWQVCISFSWLFIKVWLQWRQNDEQSTTSQFPTKKPICPACQAEERLTLPSMPPPVLEYQRGRPRSVDTSNHYCPSPTCSYYGWVGRNNIRSNGHPNGGTWRQLQCIVCGTYFMETEGTIFYRSSTPPETIWHALAVLAEGLNIRATA